MNSKMLAPTPPMGWNSWNTFSENINEDLICTTADAMVEHGLLAAGYQYLIIDDCWALRQRDAHGKLVPDPEKFPHGMKAIADYVHAKGLKFGMYSCCGTLTCAAYPGSFEHEFSDAGQFAEWGVDYLKYDNCYKPHTLEDPLLYRRMGTALKNCGRDIVFAACQWGNENVWHWIRSTGAHTYRSTEDIRDSWTSIEKIARSQLDHQCFQGPDCFNDMDMLVVGMYGKGMNPFISIGGCTDEEYQTHFALWAMMGSPLIIGCDIRSMSDQTKALLTNTDIIAINQDPECRSCYQLPTGTNPDVFILVKHLQNGDFALGFFNFSDTASNVHLNFWDMGIPSMSDRGLHFYDCLTHQTAGVHQEYFFTAVASHACKVYRCGVVKP